MRACDLKIRRNSQFAISSYIGGGVSWVLDCFITWSYDGKDVCLCNDKLSKAGLEIVGIALYERIKLCWVSFKKWVDKLFLSNTDLLFESDDIVTLGMIGWGDGTGRLNSSKCTLLMALFPFPVMVLAPFPVTFPFLVPFLPFESEGIVTLGVIGWIDKTGKLDFRFLLYFRLRFLFHFRYLLHYRLHFHFWFHI